MTTKHPKSNFGIDDPKFKWGLILGIPCVPLVIGFLLGNLGGCYFFDCNSTNGKQLAEDSFWLGFGLGIFGFIMLQRITKNLYKRGELIWSALDKQNDLCNVCGRLITENDEFYFKENKIFCIKDDPWVKERSSK